MAASAKQQIGTILCQRGYLDNAKLDAGLARQEFSQKPLGQILVELGYISKTQLNEALSVQAGIDLVDLDAVSVDAQVLSLVPAELVSKYSFVPIGRNNGHLDVAMADPFDQQAIEDLRVVTGQSIRRHYSHPVVLERAILKYYGSNVARMLENLVPAENIEPEGETTLARLCRALGITEGSRLA